MLIENVLPHCIDPACKIFLLKRLFSPKKRKKEKGTKKSVPGFLLQPLFSLRWQHLLVVFKIVLENELAQTNLNS